MKARPEFLITYLCPKCGQKSNLADAQEARCHYCQNTEGLQVLDSQKITPELMEQQLKASVERMFTNLQSAFGSMTDEDKAAFGEKDAEKEMLLLLAKAKKFKEEIEKLNFKETKDGDENKE